MNMNRTKRMISLLLALMFVALGCFGVLAGDGDNTATAGNDTSTGAGNTADQGGNQTPGDTQNGNNQTPGDTQNQGGTQNSGNDQNQGGNQNAGDTQTPGDNQNQGNTPSDTPESCKNGHDLGDWVTRSEPTCTQPGYKSKYCKRCNQAIETEEIAKLGHDFKVVDKRDATCSAAGFERKKCTRCQAEEYKEIEKLQHTDANKDNKCDKCGATITEDPCAKGHDYEEKVIAPTCEAKGKTVYTCKRCKHSYEDKVTDALGHDVVTDPAEEPTCQKEGKTEKKYCKREGCGKVFTESKTLAKVDHKGVAEDPVAATCLKEGTTGKIVCQWCGKVLQEPTVTPKSGHDYKAEVITAATCTGEGLSREVCKNCGDTRIVVTSATGHDYESTWIVEATCTSSGVRVRTCKNCGDQTDKENVAPLGHDLEKKWTVDKAPGCTTAGTKSHHCTRCGKQFDVTTVPKAGHNYKIKVKPATTKKDGTKHYLCKVCGKDVTKVIYQIDTIKLAKTTYVCDNKAKTPTVVVKNTAEKKLTKDTDYKVTYAKGRKKVGTYTVTVTFMGDYKGAKTLKFNIKLGKTTGLTLTKQTGHKIKVAFDKVRGAQKYCIYYATSKKGEYKKLVTTDKLTYTTGAMRAGKTYYFKVRALTVVNDKNQFGAYSDLSKIVA